MPLPLSQRSDSQGLLIIRAWVEEGSEERLRAEVRVTADVSAGIQRTVTLARAEEVRLTVDAWLASVLGEEARGITWPPAPPVDS